MIHAGDLGRRIIRCSQITNSFFLLLQFSSSRTAKLSLMLATYHSNLLTRWYCIAAAIGMWYPHFWISARLLYYRR
jgi:hypothetical protein